jgi:hypothetical protein
MGGRSPEAKSGPAIRRIANGHRHTESSTTAACPGYRRASAQNPYLQLGNELYQSQCATCQGELYDPGGRLGPETGAIPAFYVGSRYLLMASPQPRRRITAG